MSKLPVKAIIRVAVITGAFCGLLAFGAAIAEDGIGSTKTMPFEQVRTLQLLQEKVAEGNTHAVEAQRNLVLQMDEDFVSVPASVWQDPRNARAAIIHQLSGGHPRVMRHLVQLDPLPAIDKVLMDAAIAYVDGREEDLAALLEGVDPLELPPSLGGHIALIKAAPFIRSDPAKAMDLLQVASLLMPGTLVEEAALRREVFVAGMLGDVERFRVLSIRYLRRFKNSVYAGDFRRRFAVALDTLGFVQSEDKFARLDGVLQEFDGDSRRGLYLRLTRAALLGGNLSVAQKASDEALGQTVAGTHEYELLKIYQAATRLDPEKITDNRNLLWSVDKSKLTARDLEFLDAVYVVLNSIRDFPAPPDNVIGEFNVASNLGAPTSKDWNTDDMYVADKLLQRTQKKLAEMEDQK